MACPKLSSSLPTLLVPKSPLGHLQLVVSHIFKNVLAGAGLKDGLTANPDRPKVCVFTFVGRSLMHAKSDWLGTDSWQL